MNDTEKEPSIRDTISAAMGGDDTEESHSEVGSDASPVEASAGATETGGSGAESGDASPGGAGRADSSSDAGARARDASGKFTKTPAPKKGATSQAAPPIADKATATAAPAKGEETASTAPVSQFKAPQSWKPAAREALAKADPLVQQEVARRERETAIALQESAPARKFQADFNSTIQQFAPLVGNADPLTAVRGVMHMANQMAMGSPTTRAEMFAHLMRSYPTDIAHLDALLAGQPQKQSQSSTLDPNQLTAQVSQQVLQHIQAQQAERAQAKASSDLEAWAQDKEFLDDVREEMADLFELAAKRGRNLSWDDAYNLATSQHPEISGILKQRQQASEVSNAQASTARAKAAASSVKTKPTGLFVGKEPNTLRDHLLAAFDSAGRR